jgi:enoyl-CoA hydratase/carnithine racemase
MPAELLTTTDGHVCTVALDRAHKHNALTRPMIDAFRDAVRAAIADPAVRVIVLRGNGPTFCAGLDLREMAAEREAGETDLGDFERVLHELEECPKPTIAAVQGNAIAGGCELALHCDLLVAAENARFSMPLARIGLAVPVTLTWKLVDTIGAAATYELLFTGEAVDAATALRLRMVNRVVPTPQLEEQVAALARGIASNAPLSVRAMKAFVRRAVEFRRERPRDDLEALHRQVRQSEDFAEGLAAQRERRSPRFRGV